MTNARPWIAVLALVLSVSPLFADRVLDGRKAERLEVRDSMLGFRDTLLFFTFKDQRAILVLTIGNKDDSFPVTAKVHLFDESVTGEDLQKWINNQHSDGLFADVPEPVYSAELPEESCKVTSRKQTGTSKGPDGKAVFNDHEVKLSVGKHAVDGKFALPAFTAKAKVHVPQK